MEEKIDRREALKTISLAGLSSTILSSDVAAAEQVAAENNLATLFDGAPTPSRLLVISADDFVPALSPLLEHKNSTGMPSHLIKLSDIVGSLPDPASHPLAIKKVIAEGHQYHGVCYVMLVGDASKIPVRHRFVRQSDGGKFEGMNGTHNPTDHYYANLYNIGGQTAGLSDWDADKNGFYNESTWTYDQKLVDGSPRTNNPDKVDGYPHVALGRVPAHTIVDVRNYVQKVIDYELGMRSPSQQSFAFVGDTRLPGSPNSCEEMIASSGIKTLPNVKVHKMLGNLPKDSTPPSPWQSWSRFGSAASERDALDSKWLIHVGHGSTNAWGITLDDGQALDDERVRMWSESHVYPLVFSVGCDTGTLLNWAPQHEYRGLAPDQPYHFFFYKDTKKIVERKRKQLHAWPLEVPPPHPYDFPSVKNRTFACAWLFASPTGGAIAYAGASLVHQGATYGGALFMRVLRQASKMVVLGDAWVQGQRDYIEDKLFLEDILGSPRIFLGIQTLFGDPSLRLTPVIGYGVSVLPANGKLTVFARTELGTLANKCYDDAASKWSDWVHLDEGQLSSGPSAVWADERLTVFARSVNGMLTNKHWNAAEQKWSEWSHFEDGKISSAASVIMSGKRLVVFARDLKGHLTHRFYDTIKKSWTSWIGIGTTKISSAPSAVISDERLTVFARLSDGRLGHTCYDETADGWVAWTPVIEGEIASAPSAVMTGEQLTVFARGIAGTLMQTFYDPTVGKWIPWKELGTGAISSAPSAVMFGSRLTVFARAINGMLTHKFYDGDWSDWLEIGDSAIT